MFKTAVAPAAAAAVQKVLESGMLGEGERVVEFTRLLEKHFRTKRVIPLNSCTSALTLALRLFGIGPGKTVLSSPFTMVATSCAIADTGAEIKWFDPALSTLSVEQLHHVFDMKASRVDAVMITLVGGIAPPVSVLRNIFTNCRLQGIPLILDCAHVFDAQYDDGRLITDYCDVACVSHQAIKFWTTGDGGSLILHDDLPEHVVQRAERLKWFGMSRIVPPGKTRLEHQMTAPIPEPGFKLHMNDVAAAIGISNYLLAVENVCKARNNAEIYQEIFKPLAKDGHLQLLSPANRTFCSWWIYGFLATRRQELFDHLTAKGITCTPMWRRNDEYAAFQPANHKLPNMERIAAEICFIPNGWWLTEEQRQYIADSVLEFYR